ncbi:radical SAM protein [candidate division NPL-UPA2 bacterium]|nr:radical SAM protein [candidate division NPL-UPA2 bacterium]
MSPKIINRVSEYFPSALEFPELLPRMKTAATKHIANGVARLPYSVDGTDPVSKLLNHTSQSCLKGLMNLAKRSMENRQRCSLAKGRINAVQYQQRLEFLSILFGVIEEGFLKLNPKVRKAIVNNLIINNMEVATLKKREFEKKYGYPPPALFVISPTMACNLKCTGCYAYMYDRNKGLNNETIDDILNQGKDIGIYFVTVSGGEPFLRKDDMLRMVRKHNDIYFLFYTNATFIDEDLAKEMAELGNITAAISVEGFRRETEARRGKGVHDKILKAMNLLRENGIFYGFSFTAVRNNHDVLLGRVRDEETGKDFIQYWMDEQGCWYGWIFNYIPTGRNPDMSLMPAPQQTDERGRFVKELRSKGYLVTDFWTDGYLSGESVCIAGGRNYFHITPGGDVEPCVFAHYSAPGNNIKERSLVDILNSDYFRKIRERRFDNPLGPCMLIHHPELLRQDYEEFDLRETDGEPAMVADAEVMKGLDEWSQEYRYLADAENRRLAIKREFGLDGGKTERRRRCERWK